MLLTAHIIKVNKNKTTTLTEVSKMSGYEFESYLKDIFKNLNYKVKQTPLSNDQGADLIIERDKVTTVVQAKRYSKPVGNKAVQEAISAKHYYNTNKAMVITNNSFTRSAKELAKRTKVKLWDKTILNELV